MKKNPFFQSINIILASFVFLLLANVAYAQIRNSTNYQIHSDSINVGRGYSSSTSYVQESTVGEIATGNSSSTNYQLLAGYQQMQEIFLSLSVSGDVTLSPSLPGITGGESNGSTTVTVTTDNPAGYQLLISAENSPAMQRDGGGATIDDYDAGADPDYTFSVAGGEAYFGFTPEGQDIVQQFLNNGSNVCNTGASDDSLACWDGLSTSNTLIAEASGSNHPDGSTTTVNFRVGLGASSGVLPGVYTATTTVTALPL